MLKTERQVVLSSRPDVWTDGITRQILAETYEAMPAYRLCTSDGVVQLTEGLASKLRQILERRVREEAR